jgi:two-component system, LytTR family, sensor kinase
MVKYNDMGKFPLSDLNSYKKRQLFWTLQVFGWLLYTTLLLAFITVPSDKSLKSYLLNIFSYGIGFGITLILWQINRKLRQQKIALFRLSMFIGLSTIALAFLWNLLDTVSIYLFFNPEQIEKTEAKYFTPFWIINHTLWYTILLIPWNLSYFLINFWLDWNQQKRLAERNKELFNQAKLIMLRNQLNPHFFFNSLNSIDALIDENKEQAKEMIYKLSDFLRYSLLSDNSPVVKLQEELEIIRKYFDIEKVRFDEDLQITYEIDPATLHLLIPGFVLNPLVENAVKYGMKTTRLPLRVHIATKLEGNRLWIKISNTGKWTGTDYNLQNIDANDGIGIKNVYQRLENFYNADFHFNIATDHDQVEISIDMNPFKIVEHEG